MSDASKARAFGDYLTSIRIENQVDEVGDAFEIWVHDEDQINKAKEELDLFNTNPDSEQFQNVAKIAKQIHKQKEREQKERNKLYVDVRTQTSSFAGNRATLAMILLSVLIYALQMFASKNPIVAEIVARLYIDDPLMRTPPFYFIGKGEIWRLVTPIFMHGGLIHILFNMYWLFTFGTIIEGKKGVAKFLLIVFIIAAFSNVVQYVIWGPRFLGMSGVNFGLLGYVWMKMKYKPSDGIQIEPSTITIMMVWMVICILGFMGPVANGCHVGGLLAGIAIGALPYWYNQFFRKS